jgi:hypothetical protein
MWADSQIYGPVVLMGQHVFDGPEGQHDEAECRVGGVKAIGAISQSASRAD